MSASRILVVDDEADIRQLLQEILSEEGYEVETAGNAVEARQWRTRLSPDLVLLDIWMPDVDGITLLREWTSNPGDNCPVVMMSGHGTVETAVEATRLGAFDFIEKPLSMSKLLVTVDRALNARRHPVGTRAVSLATAPFGRSRVVQQFRIELTRLAAVTHPLLLIVERGSDPEGLARFAHQAGPRAAEAYAVFDGRLTGEELAAEVLCGTAGGTRGLLEQTHRGSLYVGDIEELPVAARRVLTAFVETGSFCPVGDSAAKVIDVRLLGCAQAGIENRIAANGIERDFYSQLMGLSLRVPPLREYAEDVPDLLRHAVDQLTEHESLGFRRFSVAAQNRLRNYPWPGNQRELRDLVRRVLLRGGAEEVSLDEAEHELVAPAAIDGALVKQDLLALPLREAREHFERAYLTQQLQLSGGKVGILAKRVGMERTHLYRKLRSLDIDIAPGAD